MLKDIGKIQELIKEQIEENALNDEFFYSILNKTEMENKIEDGVIANVFNQTIPIYTLSEDKCYYILDAIYRTLKHERYNPENSFSIEEINRYKMKVLDQNNFKPDNEITLHHIIQMNSNHWSGISTYKEWAEYMDDCSFYYKAGELQREGITKETSLGNIVVPYINRDSVNSMEEAIWKNKFVSADTIMIIVLNSDKNSDLIVENKKNEIMKIIKSKKMPIYLIDGMHRSLAFQRVVSKAKKTGRTDILDRKLKIDFACWNIQEAQWYIHQQQQGNKMSEEYVKTLNTDNNYMKITREINTLGNEGSNELFNQLAVSSTQLKFDGYCLMATFADSLEITFGNVLNDQPRQYEKIKSFLIKFYNELLGIFREKYGNVKNLREVENSVVVESNMFSFYNGIAKELYDNQNITKEDIGTALELFVDKVNWNKDNILWDNNGVYLKKSKTGTKKLVKLGAKMVRSVID